MEKVRVRFAPSPTGPLHIGGVRTALYNYLFAKKHNGTFVLRVEDTDQKRFVENAEQYIIDALKWCQIDYDEGPDKEGSYGPYKQSLRGSYYNEYIQKLIENRSAYYAFDTPEQLDYERKESEKNGNTFLYNWENRDRLTNSFSLSKEEVLKKIDSGENYVIRFKTFSKEDANTSVFVKDEIRGEISFQKELLDDKVLYKSDGTPTYHFANIVDDHLMEISHVIRGEEWLPSLPLHVLLYEALEWQPPVFVHLPLLLKPSGKGKLSKRDGDSLGFPVFPLAYQNLKTQEISRGYREDGYFSDSFVNMLALLGWNPGTEQEIFSMEELIAAFDFSKVSKSGAKFSLEKTRWFNQQYLQKKTIEVLSEDFMKLLSEKKLTFSEEYVFNVIELLKERAVFVKDFWSLGNYFFEAPKEFDAKALKKCWKPNTPNILNDVISIIEGVTVFSSEEIESKIKDWIQDQEGIGFGNVLQPLRVSIVGAIQGPDLFKIISLLGKEESLKRIRFCIQANNNL